MTDRALAWSGFWVGYGGVVVLAVASAVSPGAAVYLAAWGWAFLVWFGFVTWMWRDV